LSTNYENLKNWILNSGLIISNKDDENLGGVYSFYDESQKKYSFLYPEITGYTISALSFLYEIEQNDSYLEKGIASFRWLKKIFKQYGGIVQGINDSDRQRKKLAYSFDTAICSKGLLDLYQITNDKEILQTATQFTDWMIESIDSDGSMMPYMNLDEKKFHEKNNVWYKQKGCLHIKTCMPLLQLYTITHEEKYKNLAESICNNFKNFQNEDGSFLIHKNTKTINLHTQAYAVEGLLFAYNVTKNPEYLESCKIALKWCISNIENDGSIRLWFNFKDQSKAMYPIAQIIRLLSLVQKIDESLDYQKPMDNLMKFLLSLQAQSNDIRINGGFYEEYFKSLFGWKKRLKLNSWGSLFALQALYWYENSDKIKFETSITKLY